MNVLETSIPGVKILEPVVFRDARGTFAEVWNERSFRAAGLDLAFVQDNQSESVAWTLRGLHYQVGRPQGKLVQCPVGAVFDVAVDLRRSSPTFGRWVGEVLSRENRRQLWIPPGFAHGFLAVTDGALVTYKCSDYYEPRLERAVAWNDPQLAIEWPLEGHAPLLSDRDAAAPLLAEAQLHE